MEKKIVRQSKGLTIFGSIFIILGIIGIAIWVVMSTIGFKLVIPSEESRRILEETLAQEFVNRTGLPLVFKTAASFLCLIFSVLFIISGIGILRLKRWARITSVYIFILWAAFNMGYESIITLTLAKGFSFKALINFVEPVLWILWAIFIFWFFNRSSVKAQFEHPLQKLE